MALRLRIAGAAVALALLAVLAGARSDAQTATGSLKPSMTIAADCITSTSTATLSFPEYLPNQSTPLTAAPSAITITCTNTTAWSITASKGNNSTHATGTCGSATCSRAMTNGTAYIGYDLFVGACCSGTTVWNTTNTISGTGDGSAQTISFWGEVAASQNVAAGTYTDTVVATYTY
ncbi:MAG TPA: spore coat protein U domain-containing protein [Verrucomicrobiae bacterium]|nr:spore coat protein U domain-containing protein [Verrucomicrobiae bacterium]